MLRVGYETIAEPVRIAIDIYHNPKGTVYGWYLSAELLYYTYQHRPEDIYYAPKRAWDAFLSADPETQAFYIGIGAATIGMALAPGKKIGKIEKHHPFTKKIVRNLDKHPVLSKLNNKIKYKDRRFVFQSLPDCHSGYCKVLHRNIEKEVEIWLLRHQKADIGQFFDFMNEIYSRKEISERIPNVHFEWVDY